MTSRSAHSAPFYVESLTGFTVLRGTNTAFGSSSSEASNTGFGQSLGLFYSPFRTGTGVDLQLGIQNHYLTASQGATDYTVVAPAGVLRIQILMLYFSAGIAPYFWYRAEPQPGFENLRHAESTLAYVGDLGILYPVTPQFSLGAAASLLWFSGAAGMSPSPSSNLAFVMRFHFTLGDRRGAGAADGANPEFQGWRYIGK